MFLKRTDFWLNEYKAITSWIYLFVWFHLNGALWSSRGLKQIFILMLGLHLKGVLWSLRGLKQIFTIDVKSAVMKMGPRKAVTRLKCVEFTIPKEETPIGILEACIFNHLSIFHNFIISDAGQNQVCNIHAQLDASQLTNLQVCLYLIWAQIGPHILEATLGLDLGSSILTSTQESVSSNTSSSTQDRILPDYLYLSRVFINTALPFQFKSLKFFTLSNELMNFYNFLGASLIHK